MEIESSIWFYQLSTSNQKVYTSDTGTGAYTANRFNIQAKLNVLHPNPTVITWKFEFQDFHAPFPGIPAGSDFIDGTFTIHCDDRRSVDRVVAPQPTYVVLGGGDFT